MPPALLSAPRPAPPRPWPLHVHGGATLRRLLEFAVLAPSGHNTQPWRFRIDGDCVELRADRERRLPVVDPHDRAMIISCGAALAFLRVAIRALGRIPRVRRFPDADDPDLLAIVGMGEPCGPTLDEVALFAAIRRRRTNRHPFEDRAIPERVLATLAAMARQEETWTRILTGAGEKEAVAALVAEGDRRQGSDPAFRRELAAWMRPNHSRARDGMRGSAFGLSELVSVPFPWIIRTFDWGNGQAARDGQLAAGSPALLVLGTADDTPEAWLRCGEGLGMLLLRGCVHGLSASFLNQPVEVPALREELARLLGVDGFPQLVLRMGYGPAVPATPRRAVDEVLVT